MKHITLLSTQIKLCLFISTHKSLRSKATLSHRFKILRAIWHKVAISHKNFLIGTSFALYQKNPPLGILNRSPGVQRSADLWGTFWLLFRTSEKVTLKRPWKLLGAWGTPQKVTQNRLFYAFRETKSTLSKPFAKKAATPAASAGTAPHAAA